ncbi:MAG: polymerase subunit alpha, partial [Abditibacteriota bacterium]|nr:polymerase subunit alpha [Abditibacteriota bacterium]
EVLKDTYGMLLYQEQVMQASQVLANFTGGQSETLMKAMSKKKADEMASMKPLFIEGCRKNQISEKDAVDIFDRMEAFARYAFNKSHAAYYGLVSYWTAWLKTNYTPEFMACKMTSLLEKKDKLLIIIDDCRKHGLEVLPPDVNESNHEFTAVGEGDDVRIRFGMQAIKGIGEAPVNAICEARKESGKFVSLYDFCERVPPRACGKSAIETLIKCGAFDSIHPNRQAMLDAVHGAMDAGAKAQADALSGQNNLFAVEASSEVGRPKTMGTLPDVLDASRDDRLAWEKEFLGLYISDHPLLPLRGFLERRCVLLERIGEDRTLSDGAKVEIGGMVTVMKKMVDKNGRTWCAFTLEDLTGSIEVLAFAKTFDACGECVAEDAKLLVRGRLTADNRRGGRNNNNDDDEGDGENTVYKIMADEIELIPVEQVAEYDDVPQSTLDTPDEAGVAGSNAFNAPPPGYAANGNGHSNGNGHNGNGHNGGAPAVAGISMNRSVAGESNGNSYSNGTNANGYRGSNGNGQSNGNGHSNGNSSSNGNGQSSGNSNGSANGNGSFNANGDYNRNYDAPPIAREFAPPEWANDCVHLYVGEEHATADVLTRLWSICKAHRGETEVWLHLDNGIEMIQLKVANAYFVEPTAEFYDKVLAVLGEERVLVPDTAY